MTHWMQTTSIHAYAIILSTSIFFLFVFVFDFLLEMRNYEWFNIFFLKFLNDSYFATVNIDRWAKGLIVGFSYTLYWNFIFMYIIFSSFSMWWKANGFFLLLLVRSPVDINVISVKHVRSYFAYFFPCSPIH